MLSLRAVRRATISVCVAGIAGMIVTSALDHSGAALTFGIVTAIAILCSMVATSVTADAARRSAPDDDVDAPADALAERVEQAIRSLTDDGVDETALRQLVGEAVRLGRTLAQPSS